QIAVCPLRLRLGERCQRRQVLFGMQFQALGRAFAHQGFDRERDGQRVIAPTAAPAEVHAARTKGHPAPGSASNDRHAATAGIAARHGNPATTEWITAAPERVTTPAEGVTPATASNWPAASAAPTRGLLQE